MKISPKKVINKIHQGNGYIEGKVENIYHDNKDMVTKIHETYEKLLSAKDEIIASKNGQIEFLKNQIKK